MVIVLPELAKSINGWRGVQREHMIVSNCPSGSKGTTLFRREYRKQGIHIKKNSLSPHTRYPLGPGNDFL